MEPERSWGNFPHFLGNLYPEGIVLYQPQVGGQDTVLTAYLG